jgi:hypothetical protein
MWRRGGHVEDVFLALGHLNNVNPTENEVLNDSKVSETLVIVPMDRLHQKTCSSSSIAASCYLFGLNTSIEYREKADRPWQVFSDGQCIVLVGCRGLPSMKKQHRGIQEIEIERMTGAGGCFSQPCLHGLARLIELRHPGGKIRPFSS